MHPPRILLHPLTLLFALSLSACIADPSSDDFVDEEEEGKADGVGDATADPIEDVHRYDDCLVHGTTPYESFLNMGILSDREPGTRATFFVAECIVFHLKASPDLLGPYNLQSFKKRSTGDCRLPGVCKQTFFFKRVTDDDAELPECLKVKLSVVVGATDDFVTIERVKKLPAARPDGFCEDNGET